MKRTALQFAVAMSCYFSTCFAVEYQFPGPDTPEGKLLRLSPAAWKNESAEANRKIVAELVEILDSPAGRDMSILERTASLLQVVARNDAQAAATAVPALVRRLPTTQGRAQCEAIRALGAIGQEAKPAMLYLENLANGEADTYAEFAKSNAIGALARIVPAESRGTYETMLIKRLHSEHDFVRWTAADALGRLTPTEEIKTALAGAMRVPNLTVRAVAAEAWCRLGYPSDQLVLDTIGEVLRNGSGSAYMKPLMLAMDVPSCQINALGAVKFLINNEGRIPDELRRPYVKCLTDDDPFTRLAAFRVLQETNLSGPDVIAAVKQMMRMEISKEQFDEAHALLAKLESSKSSSSPQ